MYENGYTNVSALLGGTAEWVKAGYPMESSAESEADAGDSSSEEQAPTTSSEVPRIPAEELKERLDNGEEIVVVDSRWKDPYDLKHIAGAILPAESPLDELPRDQEIVFYCDCPREADSAGAALKLYENGYTNVSALLGGMAAWEAAGYPMESSAESEADAGDSSSEEQAPTTRSEVPRVSAEELKERLDNGEDIVIVDTRSKDPYALEHIAGAILPAESPLDEISRDQEIVIYCT